MVADMESEVIVVGGGPAGLSAALVLGRARRRVVLVDDGAPSNAPAHAIGGLLGQDGTAPLDLLAAGRRQLAALPTVEVLDGTASGVRTDGTGVEVDVAGVGNGVVRAGHVLLATGMRYRRPDLPGLEELWGDTVFHCPFCHGWEVRDRPLAVLATGAHAAAAAQLLRAWTDDVVLLCSPDELDADAAATLAARGIGVEPRPVASLRAVDGRLAAVVLADGTEIAREGLLLQAPPEPRDGLIETLGLERRPHGSVVVDPLGRTSNPRISAAGDLCEHAPNVAVAIASGSRAAAGVVHALLVA